MRLRFLLLLIALCSTATLVQGYPPAPFHRIYGYVRDERGKPLAAGVGTIILSGSNNQEIVRSTTGISPGSNYSLSVPMDSGTTSQLYSVSALRPQLPFTIRVLIDNVSYVPLQMSGGTRAVGSPSLTTRLDLMLGVDSDGDGLPDAWEYEVIDSDLTGRLRSLADIRPLDDLDQDGITNINEYLAGTYPLDSTDGLQLKIIEVKNKLARLRFLAISGRTYSISSSASLSGFTSQSFSTLPTGESRGFSIKAMMCATWMFTSPRKSAHRPLRSKISFSSSTCNDPAPALPMLAAPRRRADVRGACGSLEVGAL